MGAPESVGSYRVCAVGCECAADCTVQGRVELEVFALGELGEFEFVEGRVEREGQRDEVLATGMALAYKAVVNHQAATAAVVVPTS